MTAINKITQEDVDFFSFEGIMMNSYQRIAQKSAIYPGRGSFFGLSYCAHKLAGEAGEFNDHLGKAMRDDGILNANMDFMQYSKDSERIYSVTVKSLTDERRDLLINEIGDCLWYLSALCNELGITLFTAALMNLKKLKSRTDREMLQGSGDKR